MNVRFEFILNETVKQVPQCMKTPQVYEVQYMTRSGDRIRVSCESKERAEQWKPMIVDLVRSIDEKEHSQSATAASMIMDSIFGSGYMEAMEIRRRDAMQERQRKSRII